MPVSNYFDTVFGVDGTLTTVPDAVQSDGSVSYTQGYGPDYQLTPGTSGAKYPGIGDINQIFNDITTALQQYQQNGIPPFITSAMNGGTAFSYAKYATVLYNGTAYISNTAANTDTPPSSKWNQISLSSVNQFTGGTSTGSANAQVLASLNPATGFSTSVNGQSITFTAGYTNTGSTTLAITSPSVSAQTIQKLSGGSLVNLTGGEITATDNVTVSWNLSAGVFVLQTSGGLGSMAPLNIGNNMANDTNGNAVAQVPPLTSTGTNVTYTLAEWGTQAARSNSGTAMADTLPGTSGALPSGWYIQIQNKDATAADVVSVGSGGSMKFGNQTLSSLIIEPGETWLAVSQGSGNYVIQRVSDATWNAPAPSSSHKKLAAVWASNTTASMSADAVIVQDSSGNTRRLTSYSQTVNSATSGAGGLDTGSVAASTWYYLYAIYNPATNTQSILMSASATAPTLPSGYTFASGSLSAVLTDGSAHFIGFKQIGNKWQYVLGNNLSSLPQMASGTSGSVSTPTWTSLGVGGYVPTAIAETIKLVVYGGSGGTGLIICAPNNSYGAYTSSSNPPPVIVYPDTSAGVDTSLCDFVLESSNIYWASNESTNAIYCMGFTINI